MLGATPRRVALIFILAGVSGSSQLVAQDDARVRSLASSAVKADWTDRTAAVKTLADEYGPDAVNVLLRWSGKHANAEQRTNAVMALRRLGPAAVPALAAALQHEDALVRNNLCLVLAESGDVRSVPALLRAAERDADEVVRRHAREALDASAGQETDAGQAFVRLARRLLAEDEMIAELTAEGGDGRLYFWDEGGQVVASRETPPELYAAAYARLLAEDALRLDPGNEDALVVLITAYGDLADTMSEAEVDSEYWQERLPEITDLLLMSGVEVGGSADGDDVDEFGDEDADAAAAEPPTPVPGAYELIDSDNKRFRYNAALSLAAPGADAQVVRILADALSESAVRKVLVINDSDKELRDTLALFSDRDVTANGALTGAMGLVEAKATPQDVVIVRSTVSDVPPDRLIGNLRRDVRTQDVSVIVVSDESERDRLSTLFGDDVVAVVPAPVNAAVLAPALEAAYEAATLNSQRMEAEEFARRASEALSGLDADDLGPAEGALVDAIGRSDEVQIPALLALAKLGSKRGEAPAIALFLDASASLEARIAASDALCGILGANDTHPDTIAALNAALESEDSEIRSAAARVLGCARSVTATERAQLLLKHSLAR